MENKKNDAGKEAAVVLICIGLLVMLEIIFILCGFSATRTREVAMDSFSRGEYELFAYCFNKTGKTELFIEADDMPDKIPSTAFDGCDKLKFNEYGGCVYVSLEDNPYYFLVEAREMRDSYEIHADTKVICDGAFRSCRNISEFIVPSGNECFSVLDGTLYTKDGIRLIHYATGRSDTSLTIPESVREIDSYAFWYSSHLREIILPRGLVSIGDGAFGFCLIEEISMPNTAVVVGKGAFANSSVKVNY